MSDVGDAVIQQLLKTLKLPAMRREYDQLARQARADSWSYEEYLRELLDIEIRAREASTTARRLSEARFPDLKTLGQIDWDAMAGVSKQQILELPLNGYLRFHHIEHYTITSATSPRCSMILSRIRISFFPASTNQAFNRLTRSPWRPVDRARLR